MVPAQVSNQPIDPAPTTLEYGYYAELARSRNIAQFRSNINDLVRRLGFSEYVYIRLENTETPQRLLNTLPEELTLSYHDTGLFEHDMILERAKEDLQPFLSSTIHDYVNNAPFTSDMTDCMRGIQELNYSFGYYDFYNIPILSLNGKGRALLSITQRGMSPADLQRTITGYESTLRLLCEAIDAVALNNFPDDFINADSQQRQQFTVNAKPLRVLSTLANYDYSINEIAEKLCISVVTVNQHLKTVRNSLGTKTNYAAIKQAVQANLIQFTTQPNSVNNTNEN